MPATLSGDNKATESHAIVNGIKDKCNSVLCDRQLSIQHNLFTIRAKSKPAIDEQDLLMGRVNANDDYVDKFASIQYQPSKWKLKLEASRQANNQISRQQIFDPRFVLRTTKSSLEILNTEPAVALRTINPVSLKDLDLEMRISEHHSEGHYSSLNGSPQFVEDKEP